MKKPPLYVLLLLALLSAPWKVLGQTILDSLYVVVTIQPNGDGKIVEKRMMHVGQEGTELFIPVNRLDAQSRLSGFKVFDEHGELYYEYVSDWESLRSRDQKTLKCSIVPGDDNSFELCWGMGHDGLRTYWVSYTITNLVRSFSDVDGFKRELVAPGGFPLPRYTKVIITKDGEELKKEDVEVGGGGFNGDVHFGNVSVVAESIIPMTENDSILVSCKFRKGIFNPQLVSDMTFDEVYTNTPLPHYNNIIGAVKTLGTLAKAAVLAVIAAVAALFAFVVLMKRKKETNK